MGMLVSVYRDGSGDCTNGGLSSNAQQICVVNIEGPFEPDADCPAFELIRRGAMPVLVPYNGSSVLSSRAGCVGPMFGGNYAASSDSRFRDATAPYYGALPIFDRYETAEQYAANYD